MVLNNAKKQGCSFLKDKYRLKKWKKDIQQGGTNIDKWKHIEMETLEKFKEARESLEQVRLYKIFVNIDLQNWSFNNVSIYWFLGNNENFTTVGNGHSFPILIS